MKRKAKPTASTAPPSPPAVIDGPVSSRTRNAGKKTAKGKQSTQSPPIPLPPLPGFIVAPSTGPPTTGFPAPLLHPPYQIPHIPQHILSSTPAGAFGQSFSQPFLLTEPFPDFFDGVDPLLAGINGFSGKKTVGKVKAKVAKAVNFLIRDNDSVLSKLRVSGRSLVDSESESESEHIALQTFVVEALKQQCPKCNTLLFRTGLDVMKQARKWISESTCKIGASFFYRDTNPSADKRATPSAIECNDCSAHVCLWCLDSSAKKTHTCKDKAPSSAIGAWLSLWILLCGLDELLEQEAIPEPSPPAHKQSKPKKSKKIHTLPNPKGTGYGGMEGYNDGFSDDFSGSDLDENPDPSTPKMLDDVPDGQRRQRIAQTLTILGRVFPLTEGASPSSAITAMFAQSRLLEHARKLLRNDSLQEVTHERDTYDSLLQLLTILANSPSTSKLCLEERAVLEDGQDLLHRSIPPVSGKSKGKSKATDQRTVPPLGSYMHELAVQCDAFRRSIDAHETAFKTKDVTETLALCDTVKELAALLKVDMINKSESTSEPMTRTSSSGSSQEDPWHLANCFLEVPDSTFANSSDYYFAGKIQMQNAPSGRMKRLLMERISLSASLPPGIFIRHEASRLDVMKAIIIGPADTPYHYGAFEFDIFCPQLYPKVPPMVQFKTTGSGRESMNPNLYNDGKVCLSLLGTWSGQPWIPNTSTLLQVLLSLQAMVFCSEPYYNEPGWSNHKNDASSHAYNQNLFRATTDVAMLSWLEDMEKRAQRDEQPTPTKAGKAKKLADTPADKLWDDVLRRHFSEHAAEILTLVKGWNEDIEAASKKKDEDGTKKKKGAPPAPPPPGLHMYSLGKTPLKQLIPRLETALKDCVKRAEAAKAEAEGAEPHSQAIKSPVELRKYGNEADDEAVEVIDEGRGKRRRIR